MSAPLAPIVQDPGSRFRGWAAASDTFKQCRREIALGTVRQYHHNRLAGKFIQFGKSDRGSYCRAAGDAHQQAFFLGQTFGEFKGFVAGYLFYTIDQGEVESIGDEAGADALDLVRGGLDLLTGQFLADDRAFLGLDRNRNDLLTLGILDVARYAGDG